MTPSSNRKSMNLGGFFEKIFWVSIPIILVSVLSMIPMIYGIKTDVKVLQVTNDFQKVTMDKALQMSTYNNAILQSKADDQKNTEQHLMILSKVDTIETIMNNIYRRQSGYGESLKPTAPDEWAKASGDLKP